MHSTFSQCTEFCIDHSREVTVPIVFLTDMIWSSQFLWCDSVTNSSWDITIFIKFCWLKLLPLHNLPNIIINTWIDYAVFIETCLIFPIHSYTYCWKSNSCFSPSSFACSNNFLSSGTLFSSDLHFLKRLSLDYPEFWWSNVHLEWMLYYHFLISLPKCLWWLGCMKYVGLLIPGMK